MSAETGAGRRQCRRGRLHAGATACGHCHRLVPSPWQRVLLQAETGAWRPWTPACRDCCREMLWLAQVLLTASWPWAPGNVGPRVWHFSNPIQSNAIPPLHLRAHSRTFKVCVWDRGPGFGDLVRCVLVEGSVHVTLGCFPIFFGSLLSSPTAPPLHNLPSPPYPYLFAVFPTSFSFSP